MLSIILFHSVRFGSLSFNPRHLLAAFARPCFSITIGTSYNISTSGLIITQLESRLQKSEILEITLASTGCSDLHTKISGCIPIPCRVFTDCCVGFVFNSSDAFIYGISTTCTSMTFSFPNSCLNCLIVSING